MSIQTMTQVAYPFRRAGTAQRVPTRAPVVPSQDVSRYQAVNLPPPTFDLDSAQRDVWQSLLFPTLAVVVTGGGILLIQEFGKWLAS